MPNTIQLKRSGTASATPSSLALGELAINYADGKLFYKNGSNAIVEFSSGGGGGTPSRTVQTVTSTTQTLSPSDAYAGVLRCTLTSNVTLTLPTATNGIAFTLILRQDATGGRVVTFANTLWPSGTAPVLPTGANTFVVFQFYADGTNWYGVPVTPLDQTNSIWSIA